MRKPIAWAVVLVLIAALSVGVSQGLGASAPASVPTPGEPAVPAPGAVVTSSQIETVRQTALNVAAESGEMAPAVTMAGKTMSLAGAVPAISEQSATAPEITDPRTDKPFSQSSVFVVTMTGQFTETRHMYPDRAAPTGADLNIAIDVASGKVVSTFLGGSSATPVLPEPEKLQ